MYKEIILSKIKEYCRLKKIELLGTKCITLHCVLCDKPGCTASVIPNTAKIICHNCVEGKQRYYNLIDIARKIENKPEATDEEILTLLRDQLNLNVTTQNDELKIDTLLNKFIKYQWALVPCARNGKNPIQKEWQLKENRDKAEWYHWLNSGLNIGVRTGKASNLCVIDFDFYTKEEKAELVKEDTSKARLEELRAKKVIPAYIQAILGSTLGQETLGGFHIFYQSNDLPKTAITIEGIHVDIETEGGQIIIPPSPQIAVEEEYKDGEIVKKRVVGYGHREFINDNPILPMPKAFYDMLKSLTVTIKPTPAPTEDNIGEILKRPTEDLLKDLQGNRHNTLVKFGGLCCNLMNVTQVRKVVDNANKFFLAEPLPQSEVTEIVDSLEKYFGSDEGQVRHAILSYLAETDMASKIEIEFAVFANKVSSEHKKRLDRVLVQLIVDHKISKVGVRYYKLIREMNWSDAITNVGSTVDFKIPYLNDYAYFNKGDIILIQGSPKSGKTHLSMNFVKRLVKQGLKPYYMYNEGGGRYAKIALSLGLKDGDFFKARCSNPEDIIVPKNSICIYDWLRISDFSKTADIFDILVQKLENTNSIMIAFSQLKEKNEQFAKNLINQFVSMSVKYIYDDEQGVNTHFELDYVRDRKASGKRWQIPTKYLDETKEVKTIEELDEEERALQTEKDIKND